MIKIISGVWLFILWLMVSLVWLPGWVDSYISNPVLNGLVIFGVSISILSAIVYILIKK